MKYIVGENNDLYYFVGNNSLLVGSSGASFLGRAVYNGRVGLIDFRYFGVSAVNIGSYNDDNFGIWFPVRPVVSLESSVQLSKIEGTE